MGEATGPLREVRLPGCKSLSARALILAACAEGESRLHGLSDSADTRGMARALARLGAAIRRPADGVCVVRGWGGAPRASGVELDAGEAGSNLRFLAPLAASGATDVLLTGAPRLWERPQEPLFACLRAQGAVIETGLRSADGRPAVRILGNGLPGGRWEAPVEGSSQYLSGLLLAAPASAPVELSWSGALPSAGYVDLTIAALRAFRGHESVARGPGAVRVLAGRSKGCEYRVPGDPSGATFFLVALALRGGAAAFREPWSGEHPEARLMETLFDARLLRRFEGAIAATGRFPATALDFDLDAAPDAGPALAVLGASLPAGVRLGRIARLRLKESDRVAGILRLLTRLGARHELDGDTICVHGGVGAVPPDAGPYDPAGDHRLAMAAAIAGLPVSDAECVAKSFPDFWQEWCAWAA